MPLMPNKKSKPVLTPPVRKLIFEWRNEGLTQKEIAKRLKISQSTVSYSLNNFSNEDLQTKKRLCGRKSILSDQEKKLIFENINKERRKTRKEVIEITKKITQKDISKQTASRILNSEGFFQYVMKKVPKISEKNKNARLQFAEEYIKKPKSFWEDVIWSDEVRIQVFSSDGKNWVWRRPNESYEFGLTKETEKYNGGSIMFWGCMNSKGVGKLTKVDGTMNSLDYMVILQENLWSSVEKLCLSEFIFQQDNAAVHSSGLMKMFFIENNINLIKWPAQSPDLNVIEHVWAELKRLYKLNPATKKGEVERKIHDLWNDITPSFTEKLVNSIYRRLKAVILAKGGATKY